MLGLCVFQASYHLKAGAAWSFHWLGTCPRSRLELKAKSTTGEGTKKYMDPKHWNSDLEHGPSSLPFLSTLGGTQGSLAQMVRQLLHLVTTHCTDTQTGKKGFQRGRAWY